MKYLFIYPCLEVGSGEDDKVEQVAYEAEAHDDVGHHGVGHELDVQHRGRRRVSLVRTVLHVLRSSLTHFLTQLMSEIYIEHKKSDLLIKKIVLI